LAWAHSRLATCSRLLAVDRVWVEPATSWLRVRYSINWTTTPTESGDVYENVKVGWHKGRLWIDRLRGCMYCLNVRSLFALCAVFCFYFFSSASSCKINWLHVKGQGLQVLLPLKQWSQLRFHCTMTLNRGRVMTGLKGLSWPCCLSVSDICRTACTNRHTVPYSQGSWMSICH